MANKNNLIRLMKLVSTSCILLANSDEENLSSSILFSQGFSHFHNLNTPYSKIIRMLCGQSDFGNQKSEIGTISESILDFSL